MTQETPIDLLVALLAAAFSAMWLLFVFVRQPDKAVRPASLWEGVEIWLSLLLIIGLLIFSGMQVVVRYLLSDYVTLAWTEELARLFLVWAAMWGAATLQRTDDHIRMTVLVDALPLGAQRIIDILGDLVVLLVLGVITWYGWTTAWQLRMMSTVSLGIPVSAFALAVSVSGTLMVVHTLRNLRDRINGRQPKHVETMMDA